VGVDGALVVNPTGADGALVVDPANAASADEALLLFLDAPTAMPRMIETRTMNASTKSQ